MNYPEQTRENMTEEYFMYLHVKSFLCPVESNKVTPSWSMQSDAFKFTCFSHLQYKSSVVWGVGWGSYLPIIKIAVWSVHPQHKQRQEQTHTRPPVRPRTPRIMLFISSLIPFAKMMSWKHERDPVNWGESHSLAPSPRLSSTPRLSIGFCLLLLLSLLWPLCLVSSLFLVLHISVIISFSTSLSPFYPSSLLTSVLNVIPLSLSCKSLSSLCFTSSSSCLASPFPSPSSFRPLPLGFRQIL